MAILIGRGKRPVQTGARVSARLLAAAAAGVLALAALGGALAADSPATDDKEAQSAVTEQAKLLARIMDFSLPLPAQDVTQALSAWKADGLVPYVQNLQSLGVRDDVRATFCAAMLWAYDRSPGFADDADKRFQYYITRDAVTAYAQGGENADVLTDANGDPAVWMVNLSESTKTALQTALDGLAGGGAQQPLQRLSESGVVVLFAAAPSTDAECGAPACDAWGVVQLSLRSDNDPVYTLTEALLYAPASVAYLQRAEALSLFSVLSETEAAGCAQIVPGWIGGTIAGLLTGDPQFEAVRANLVSRAEDAAAECGLEIGGSLVQRQIRLVLETADLPGENLLTYAENPPILMGGD